jgi:hypothetical protein
MSNQELSYKEEYENYKNKYIELRDRLRDQISNRLSDNKCKYKLANNREPSNCDRIIYKSKSNLIDFKKYDVISENQFNLMQFSDHKMIYGIFEYNKKKYMIISWNMNAFDNEFDESYKDYITKKTKKFIKELYKLELEFDYLLFSFQESTKQSLFIKILIETLENTTDMILVKQKHSEPIPIFNFIYQSTFYVQLLIFAKEPIHPNKIKSGYHTFNIKQNFKHVLGTKSYVYIKINGLTIVSTHFPIKTKKDDYGNNLRLLAFDEIDNKFINKKNLIIIGDLNFRKINNSDQLDDLLKNKEQFKEAGKLSEHTCKYKECKLKCDNEFCSIIDKE